MSHDESLAADVLGFVRASVVQRDPLLEWSLGALVAGVNPLVFNAAIKHPQPVSNLLRGALPWIRDQLLFDHQVLQGAEALRPSFEPDDPTLTVMSGGLDEFQSYQSRPEMRMPAIGIALDAQNRPALEASPFQSPREGLADWLLARMLPAKVVTGWRQTAMSVTITPAQGEYAVQLIRAAQPQDPAAAGPTKAYVQRGPENEALRDLLRLARAKAFLRGANEVVDRDLRETAKYVLCHRVVRNTRAWQANFALFELTRTIVDSVPLPSKKKRRDSGAILPPEAIELPPGVAPPAVAPPPTANEPPAVAPPLSQPPVMPVPEPQSLDLMPAPSDNPYAPYSQPNWQTDVPPPGMIPPGAMQSPYAPYSAPMQQPGMSADPYMNYPAAGYGQTQPAPSPAYDTSPHPGHSVPLPRVRRSRSPSFIGLLIAYIVGGVIGLWLGAKLLVYVRDELGWRLDVSWLNPARDPPPVTKEK